MTRYDLEFEMTFQQRNGDLFPFLAESSRGQAQGSLVDLGGNAAFQELAQRLRQGDTDEDMLIELGRVLYDALFRDRVRDLFMATQGSQQEQQGIRLKIRTAPGDTEIGALPWEYLFDPNRDNPFVLLDISLVRYPQAAVRVPNLAATLPLKVLLSAAQPSDLGPTYADRELDAVRQALRDRGLEDNGHVEIIEERHLTRQKFQQLLRTGLHVWHFAGHGGFSRDGRSGVLFFEDSSGAKSAVGARDLGILLGNSGLRLVVLDACQSGQLALEPFRSIGPSLTANNIPAVIAMQFKVPEESTTAFAGEFYYALSEGLPVDACVTEGRKAVVGTSGLGNADWGIPVVYTRAPDGVLFHLPSAPKPRSGGNGGDTINVDASGSTISGGVNISTGDRTVSGSSSTPAASAWLDEVEREAQTKQLQLLVQTYYELKRQQASQGISTPVGVINDLHKVVPEIHELREKLGLPKSDSYYVHSPGR